MKITYLFGAGASKNCLPIVNEIPDRMETVISILEKKEYKLSDSEYFDKLNLKVIKFEAQKNLVEDLKWLTNESRNHASIDTFAKKLFVKGEIAQLKKLKASFSVYMIIDQILNKPDKRYDSFYASILNRNIHEFPNNLRILSWNYDSQFEISFSGYTNQKSLATNRSFLNIISKYSHDAPNNSGFSLLKLNGSTNLLQDSGWRDYNYIDELPSELLMADLELIIRNYATLRLGQLQLFSGLSFAWERFGKLEHDIVEYAKGETSETEVLVVIGYSFPYFNREIDREVIGNMKSLQKVYFQAPDADILKERFLSIRDDIESSSLLPRFDLEQFLLPNEF